LFVFSATSLFGESKIFNQLTLSYDLHFCYVDDIGLP